MIAAFLEKTLFLIFMFNVYSSKFPTNVSFIALDSVTDLLIRVHFIQCINSFFHPSDIYYAPSICQTLGVLRRIRHGSQAFTCIEAAWETC